MSTPVQRRAKRAANRAGMPVVSVADKVLRERWLIESGWRRGFKMGVLFGVLLTAGITALGSAVAMGWFS